MQWMVLPSDSTQLKKEFTAVNCKTGQKKVSGIKDGEPKMCEL